MVKINYNFRRVYLSNEGRAFKQLVKNCMPPMKFPLDCKFYMEMHLNGTWHYKNMKNKRADIQNLTKILIDAVFEMLGRDDSWLYSLSAFKHENKTPHTIVVLEDIK